LEIVVVPFRVPYAAQIASPELATRIFVEGMHATLDPCWQESGANNPEEYAYWTSRACGVACVKMCVEALGGTERPLIEWARRGVELGGYLSELRPDGSQAERGWLHSALAELIRGEGFSAEPRAADIEEFPGLLKDGNLLITSVSYEIGIQGPVTKKGGHLVVVYGMEIENDRVTTLILNNPSGRTVAMQAGARIPVERFKAGYTGRVIVVGRG
jgi:hypothetical protein